MTKRPAPVHQGDNQGINRNTIYLLTDYEHLTSQPPHFYQSDEMNPSRPNFFRWYLQETGTFPPPPPPPPPPSPPSPSPTALNISSTGGIPPASPSYTYSRSRYPSPSIPNPGPSSGPCSDPNSGPDPATIPPAPSTIYPQTREEREVVGDWLQGVRMPMVRDVEKAEGELVTGVEGLVMGRKREEHGRSGTWAENRPGSGESRCWEEGDGYDGEGGKLREQQHYDGEEGGGRGRRNSSWLWGGEPAGHNTETGYERETVNNIASGRATAGGFTDDSPNACNQCGLPWDWPTQADGSGGTAGESTQRDHGGKHFTDKKPANLKIFTGPPEQQWGHLDDGDRDLERNDCKSTDSPGWFHTAVYGLEGLNRLRAQDSPGKGKKGKEIASDQRGDGMDETMICEGCGRDTLQVLRDLRIHRNHYQAMNEKLEQMINDEEANPIGEKMAGYNGGRAREEIRVDGWGNDDRTHEAGQNTGWHQDGSPQEDHQDHGWGNSPDPNASANGNTYDQQPSHSREGRDGDGWDQTSPVFFRGWGKRDPDAFEQGHDQNVKLSQDGEFRSQGWPDVPSSETNTLRLTTRQKSSHSEGEWSSSGWGTATDEMSSETDTVQPESSSRQTWDAPSRGSNQHSANSDSTIQDSLQYLEQWGGLGGFMNAFMIDPARADAVYQAGKLILVLRAQRATFTSPRKEPWDEEMAEGIAQWAP